MAKDPRTSAWQRRDQESGGALGANRVGPPIGPTPPRPGGTGASGGAIPVVVESSSPQFLNALAQSLGFGSTTSEQSDPVGGMGAVLQGQQAIVQASKQIVNEMKLATDAIRQFSMDQSKWASDMRSARQEETKHLANLLDMVTMAKIGGGMGGGMGWPGGMPGPMPPGGYPGFPGFPGGPMPQPASTSSSPGGGYQVPYGQTTLGSLRQRLASQVHQRYGTANPANGQLTAQHNAGGQQTHYTWTRNGRTINVPLNSPHLQTLQNLASRQQHSSNLATGFAYGGVRGALRSAPYVGVAMAAGDAVNDSAVWLTDQRAANAHYQSIYGGENFNLGEALGSGFGMLTGGSSDARSGVAQRIQETGFVLNQRFSMGGMNTEQAQQAFRGTSQLGYSGAQRNNALGFMSDQYKKLGMSIEESLQLVQVSAQHANSSLAGVAKGLDTVTKAAAATGQNAEMLRQSFVSNYGAALQSGMGAGSAGLAQAFTMAGPGVNRDLSGLNYAGVLNNPGMMNLLAGQGGMTVGQMQYQLDQGNTRALTKPLQQRMEQSMLGTMNQSVRDDLRRLVAKYGGNEAVAKNQGAMRAIATELKNNRGWNVYTARQALANVVGDTSGLDDTQVGESFISTMVGAGPDAQAQQVEKQNQLTQLSPDEQRANSGNQFVRDYKAKIGKYDTDHIGFGDNLTEFIGGTSREKNTSRAMQTNLDAYSGYQKSTKAANPAIEALLTQFGDNTDARVQVQTAQGARVVTVDEAIKNFSDQISTGKAIMMNAGDQSGRSLSEITGVTVGGLKPGQNGVEDSTTKDPTVGQTVDQFKAQNKGSGAGGQSSTVTVSLTPEVARLFNFSGSGVNVQGAAAAGRPPTPTTGPK